MRTNSWIPITKRKLRIGRLSQARGQRLARSNIQSHAAVAHLPPARRPLLPCLRLPPPPRLPLRLVLPRRAGKGGAVARLHVGIAGAVAVEVPAETIQNAATETGDGAVETGAPLATESAAAAAIDGAAAATADGREREAETEREGKRGAQAVRKRRKKKTRS